MNRKKLHQSTLHYLKRIMNWTVDILSNAKSKSSKNLDRQEELDFESVRVEHSQNLDNAGKMKRLTIDVPEGLHRRIKSQCAEHGRKMADEIRELLHEKYDGVEDMN